MCPALCRVALAVTLLGCSRAQPLDVDVAPLAPGLDCDALFEPPAGAVLLCDERVTEGDAAIHWRSYGLDARRAAVTGPYQSGAMRCGFGLSFKPPLFDVTSADRRLEMFEATDGAYPSCCRTPWRSHETVVVISETTRGPTERCGETRGIDCVEKHDDGTCWFVPSPPSCEESHPDCWKNIRLEQVRCP